VEFLVLEDSLLIEYLMFSNNKNYNSYKVKKLFKYCKPHISNISQLDRVKDNLPNIPLKRLKSQLANKRLVNCNLLDLVQKTKIKIILSENKNNFPYVIINNDEFENNYTATYNRGENRKKVLKHIKSLIKSSDKIEIYDKYLLNDNQRNNTEIENHFSVKLISQIINNDIEFKVFCSNSSYNHSETVKISDRISFLKGLCDNFTFNHQNLNNHDRYIKIYKNNKQIYEIILSSGVYNILNKNKDFTYILRVIN
jgi:hypothetical protein